MKELIFRYKYTKKIHYLLISLEVLNLHLTPNDKEYFNKNQYIDQKDLNELFNRTNLTNIYLLDPNQIKSSYINIITIINILYTAINQEKSHQIIQNILKKEKLLNQYLLKFNHIYFSHYTKYKSSIKNEKITIYDIAIINLYIIYLIKKNKQILYLTYYLLT